MDSEAVDSLILMAEAHRTAESLRRDCFTHSRAIEHFTKTMKALAKLPKWGVFSTSDRVFTTNFAGAGLLSVDDFSATDWQESDNYAFLDAASAKTIRSHIERFHNRNGKVRVQELDRRRLALLVLDKFGRRLPSLCRVLPLHHEPRFGLHVLEMRFGTNTFSVSDTPVVNVTPGPFA